MGRKSGSDDGEVSATSVKENLRPGEILTDLTGKKWMLGKPIGVGGFGDIYLASDNLIQEVRSDSCYVAKVECHTSGPLFVEINCYLRTGRRDMIEQWKQEHNLSNLGMPHYVASGSHIHKDSKYRFLILPRYEKDLETILQAKRKLNLKTVLTVSMQIIDILEYIHSKGYVHSDIKASNILLGRAETQQTTVVEKPVLYSRTSNPIRKCKFRVAPRVSCAKRSRRCVRDIVYWDDIPEFHEIEELMELNKYVVKEKKETKSAEQGDQVYLLDYGLASKYRTSSNTHKPFCVDERKAHAGTLLFCSRDAHKGAQSRRSDLECLGYNIIYWLTGYLPWMDNTDDPNLVARKKQHCMDNLSEFLKHCFCDYPKFLLDYFKYLEKLKFDEKPDYALCKKLYKTALQDYGYKNDGRFDFDNLEGWGSKQKKIKENHSKRLPMLKPVFSVKSPKLLRKKVDKKALACLNWSKILIDPEIIIKKQKKRREKESAEVSDSNQVQNVLNMDISELNPTYAMIEVYNKSQERLSSPTHKTECEISNIDGYTPAMMAVLARMREREMMENSEDSENDYYYKFPTRKTTKRKSGIKRKASAAAFYSESKTRVSKLSEKRFMPAKRVYCLRG